MSITPELVQYVAQARASGMSDDTIRGELLKMGWSAPDIDSAVPAQVAGGAPASRQSVSPAPAMPKGAKLKPILAVVVIILLLALTGGGAYAYVKKLGPFSHPPYSEGNLMSGLLEKISQINSSTYSLSASLDVMERETGAVPFTIDVSNEEEFKLQYQRDAKRAQDVGYLLQALSEKRGQYPSSLAKLSQDSSSSYYRNRLSLNDPSGAGYDYSVTENGNNFLLKVTFETQDAISMVRRFSYTSSTTAISAKTVSFTKGSSPYLYFASTPPKPFLVELGESLRMMPPDVKGSVSISASTDFSESVSPNWKVNLDASGDFGDLSYKVNADALKKDSDYYFKINNIPSLFFLGPLASLKGQWIKVSSATASSSKTGGYDELSYFAAELPRIEKAYKEQRTEVLNAVKKLAVFADEERLFTFKNAPSSEKVGARSLYRYDLKLRKEALLPFYRKLIDEANRNEKMAANPLILDEGLVQYLQSEEFNKIFDYIDQNITITLWVDAQGFPAVAEYTLRLVPPDTALQLKDKQIKVLFRITADGINETINIEAPSDAKPIEEISKGIKENLENYSPSASEKGVEAAVKANVHQFRTAAELFYDKKFSYKGVCQESGSTVDETLTTILGSIKKDVGSSGFMCGDSKSAYAVKVLLKNSGVYCVDSTGFSGLATDLKFGVSCN